MIRPLVSVIVPVYNVESFLPRCLESLACQDIIDRCEIILVNDGSTDGSPALCDDFAARRGGVKVISQKNAGLSEARNTGMRAASGEYIYFLDSDDWLEVNALQTLLEYAVANDCAVVQANHYYAYNDKYVCLKPISGECVYSTAEAMELLVENNKVKNFAWGKLYRRDVVEGIRFRPSACFEDSFWMHHIVHRTARFGVLNQPLYYYRQRDTGISGTFTIKNFDLIKGNLERLSFIDENYPQLAGKMRRTIDNIFLSFYPYCRKDTALRNEFRRWLDLYIEKSSTSTVLSRMMSASDMAVRLLLFARRVRGRFAASTLYIKDTTD